MPFASNSVINAIMVLPSVFLFPILMRDTKKRIPAMFHQKLGLKTLAIGVNIVSVYLLARESGCNLVWGHVLHLKVAVYCVADR